MECKVFIDDFAPALSETLEDKIRKLSLSNRDKLIIERYFTKNFKVYYNEKKVLFLFKEYKVKDNVMTLKLVASNTFFKKGDVLKIENELLFEKFPDLQSNWVTLQIPPFFKNRNFESNFENYIHTYTF